MKAILARIQGAGNLHLVRNGNVSEVHNLRLDKRLFIMED